MAMSCSPRRHCGKALAAALVFFAALWPAKGQPQFEHNYALVIGIDVYAAPRWPRLRSAVSDARAIADFLRSQKYEVTPLYDQQATKQAILSAMQGNLARKVTARDRVVVFFAGHGYTEVLGGQERGYVAPYDADDSSASLISQADLREESSYMGNARHQLFLMDACYGGLLATRGVEVSPGIPNYIREISSRIARQVLTAGGKDQEVLDSGADGHSPFSSALLKGLRDGRADLNGDGYITFAELQAYVSSVGSNSYQTPAASTLPGHEGGEFLFTAPVGGAAPPSPSEPLAVPPVRLGAIANPAD